MKCLLPFEFILSLEFSERRISVGVMIVSTAQKKNINTKVLSIICWRNLCSLMGCFRVLIQAEQRERDTAGLGTHHYICWPFLRNTMIIIKFKTIFLYKIKNKIKKIRCICKVKNTPTKLMILVVQLLEGGCIVWVYDLGIHLASHAQVGIRTSCFAMIYFYMSIIYTWSII